MFQLLISFYTQFSGAVAFLVVLYLVIYLVKQFLKF